MADRLGVPAAWLVAGLVVGLTAALTLQPPPALPRVPFLAAQAMIGAALGAQLRPAVLAEVSRNLPAVIGVSLGTLALSVLVGLLLARMVALDRPTAVLGMLAGAAEGVVAASGAAHADARLVAVMQYVRVLAVVASVPVLVTVLFGVGAGTATEATARIEGMGGAGFLVVSVVGGLAAVALRVPLGPLVGPLALGGLAAALGVPLAAPEPAVAAALAVIGLAVGLTFDAGALRRTGRLLPAMIAAVLVVIAGSGALAVVLARVAGLDGLTAYLATSPGALNAVLATAYDTGANTPFVLAAQTLRFLIMVVAAPVLAHLWSPPRGGPRRS